MKKKVKVTLSLDEDALELLNSAITERKRGRYVSALLRQALRGEREVTVHDVVAILHDFEGTLRRTYSTLGKNAPGVLIRSS